MSTKTCPAAPTLTVHQLFEAQVRARPTALAVAELNGPRLTYRELNTRANQLARLLRARGIGHGDLVGIHLPRSIDCVVAMLAVLKAGVGYVPLDRALPEDRLRWMARDCALRFVISPASRSWSATDAAELPLAELGAELTALAGTDLELPVSQEDTCYVPYTSGSTGTPKGTVVPHRAIPGFFLGTDYGDWDENATVLMHSALSWDGHVLELYPALCRGGRVVISRETDGDPLAVARAVRTAGISTLFLTTSAFHVLATDSGPDGGLAALAGLRRLLVGGEAMSAQHTAMAAAALPNTVIVNGYGPSECTVFACVHPVSDGDIAAGNVPIGREIGDRRLHVLDTAGQPVADGVPGEMHIGGPGVGQGYLGRRALTAQRFVPDPFGAPGARLYRTGDIVTRRADGALEFVGRVDNQVKLRGYRIELGEIEAAIDGQPGVVNSAVTVHEFGPGDRRLVAYLTATGTPPTLARLRTRLATTLPEFMIPVSLTVLDRFPSTANGKIDRAALPAPRQVHAADTTLPDHEPPRTRIELRLAEAWQTVLRVDRIGRRDCFTALGGNSLLATRMISRVRDSLGVELPIRTVFETATLAELAAAVHEIGVTDSVVPAAIARIPRRAAEPVPAYDEPQGESLR